MADTVDARIDEWVQRPENTARTVLVTIFGDTLQPVTPTVWMAQLFRLTDVFGYSDRLVRTSMSRLAADGWLDNERVGRESRYTLTARARAETEEASHRIYASSAPDWSETWTLVFLDAPGIPDEDRGRLSEHLGWNGFIRLGRSVLGAPGITQRRTSELCRIVSPAAAVPMGPFEFCDLDRIVADGFFDDALALPELTSAYEAFVEAHRLSDAAIDASSGAQAFALRTMLIHDLRRIRLRSADVPTSLLPSGWAGEEADLLVRHRYPALSAGASSWLSDVLGETYPAVVPGRFTDAS